MHKLRDDEVFVIRSIASSTGGVWTEGEDPPDCYLDIEDKNIAVEISTLTQHVLEKENNYIPRLSQDMTAIRICNELDEELNNEVPNGVKVLIIIYAPITKARKFKTVLKERVLLELSKYNDEEVEINETILLTNVNIHIFPQQDAVGKKVTGVVANSRSTSDILENAKCILDKCIELKKIKCKSFMGSGEVWLALFNDYWLADIDTYKSAISSSSVEHEFNKILLVSGDGSVEELR